MKLNRKTVLFSVGITIFAFLYRIYGLKNSTPFWVDEYSTGIHALQILRYGLSIFTNPNITIETNNITTYFLVAAFLKVFSIHEWAARLPFVIIGSLVPLLVFFVARKVFNLQTAICASLLTVFSYFEIVWSRQARNYVLVQFLILAAVYLFLKLQEKPKRILTYQILFALVSLLGIMTHAFFLVFFVSLFLYILFYQRRIFTRVLTWIPTYVILLIMFAITVKTGLFSQVVGEFLFSNPVKANNFWYYHSFLWREYGMVTLLAILGLFVAANSDSQKQRKHVGLIIVYTIVHFLFVCFFLAPYVSRYLLPIFPFLLIGMSYTIVRLIDGIEIFGRSNRLKMILPVLVILFIVVSGNKFVSKPKRFYSVNHDFREIAYIDYNQLYGFMKDKISQQQGPVAIIDTWQDRLYWYMGLDYQPSYIFRWLDETGLINGLERKTFYKTNKEGEKVMPHQMNLRLVGELSDLKKVLKKYPKGFILIDDTSLPAGVRTFAEKNFKKELYLDHYSLDDNPYSIWPATLYSWGM